MSSAASNFDGYRPEIDYSQLFRWMAKYGIPAPQPYQMPNLKPKPHTTLSSAQAQAKLKRTKQNLRCLNGAIVIDV